MNSYDAIKYAKTFLNQVIIRVDFLEFLETEKIFSDDVEKVILKQFPRRGMDQKIRFATINIAIDSSKTDLPNSQKGALEGILREYSAGKNKIILSNKFVTLEVNEYESFEKHYQNLLSILSSINTKQRITTARIGIRYINLFEAENIKLRKNMFSSEIAGFFYTKKYLSNKDPGLLRSMNLTEFQVGDMFLNFRFGMFNPDYPNPLKKESFALDYDCFTTEPIDTMDEIGRAIVQGHNAIQELFESSITDSLRKVLNHG